jgi:hypothetical protein
LPKSIDHDSIACQFKKHTAVPDTQPVLVPAAFELLDIAGKIMLQKMQAVADLPPDFHGCFSQSDSRLFFDFDFVFHHRSRQRSPRPSSMGMSSVALTV